MAAAVTGAAAMTAANQLVYWIIDCLSEDFKRRLNSGGPAKLERKFVDNGKAVLWGGAAFIAGGVAAAMSGPPGWVVIGAAAVSGGAAGAAKMNELEKERAEEDRKYQESLAALTEALVAEFPELKNKNESQVKLAVKQWDTAKLERFLKIVN